jgi:putative ABC transport system permease protein
MKRLFRIFGGDVAGDVDAEFDFHLEQRINEYVAQGLTPAEAESRARARFGSRARARAATIVEDRGRLRRERRVSLFRGVGNDVRFAVRMLRRQFMPAALAIVCMAVGIGGTTAVLSVGDALLLRPLPFPNGSQLIQIGTDIEGRSPNAQRVSSYEDFLDWRQRQRSFTDMAVVSGTTVTLGATNPIRAGAAVASASLWKVLGVRAERGRVFTEEDDKPGGARVAVVAHGFAERTWGSADSAAGKQLTINGRVVDVIGVIANEQRFPEASDIWLPIARAADEGQRGNKWLTMLAALNPNATIETARTDLGTIVTDLAKAAPQSERGRSVTLAPLRERYVGRTSRNALTIAGLAALLLLSIAGANIACLQLARGTARLRDLTTRMALGASRARLMRQLLVESIVLAIVGGAAGVALGVWGSTHVGRAIAAAAPVWMTFQLNTAVLVITTVICVGAGIVFGIVPAFNLSQNAVATNLRVGSSGSARAPARTQRVLAITELALTVVLVTTATLAMESFMRLSRVETGINTDRVQTFRLNLTGPRYDSSDAQRATIARVVEGLQHMPGVASAAAAAYVPLRDCCSQFGIRPPAGTNLPEKLMVTGNQVTPTFFDALGVHIVKGRAFTVDDRIESDAVVIVNETLAKQFWPGVDPIGKDMAFGSGALRVVGVARDVKQATLLDAAEPQFYRPYDQDTWESMTFVMRMATDAAPAVRDVRAVIHAVDPSLAIGGVVGLSLYVDRAVAPRRTFGVMFTAFAVCGLALALAGVYGVLAFSVSRRRREIGVRMALGADRSQVLRLVLLQATRLAAIGGALGIVGALVAARAMQHSLYEISWGSPWRYVAVIALVLLTTLVAALGPAWRASRIDLMGAVRTD